MSSRLYVVPDDHSFDADEWSGAATFILPIKGVFGQMLCGTDGTIGDPTTFSAERALEIVVECEKIDPKHLYPRDKKDLAKVRRWAEQGKDLFAVWKH